MYSAQELDAIRREADLVSLAGQATDLKKAGNLFKGLCPFHDEKTPSFIVYPRTNTYKCYGCGAHGDSIRFIQEISGKTFLEAVTSVRGDRRDLPIVRKAERPPAPVTKSEDFSDLFMEAARFFRLHLPEAEPVLADRRISMETAMDYMTGFAPSGWRNLCDAMGEGEGETLIRAGLAVRSSTGGIIDRYRNRIMFPIIGTDGKIAGFTGRTLETDEHIPKYLNTPEEAGFHKARVFYGNLQNAESVRKSGFAWLVEGAFDLLPLAEIGIRNVYSPLSADLSTEQAEILKQENAGAVIAFDGDIPGRTGGYKALCLLFRQKIPATFISMPEGMDPGEILKESGAESLKEILKF